MFFVVAILLAVAMRLKHSLRGTVVWGLCGVFIACTLTIAIYPFGQRWTKGKLELTVLDVGQGDSLFVVSPGGKTLLIDGGAFGGYPGHEEHIGVDPGEEAVSPYLWSRGFQKLDVVARRQSVPMYLRSAITEARIRRRRNFSALCGRVSELYPLAKTIFLGTLVRSCSNGWRTRACGS